MMSELPIFSIVTVCYNSAPTLERAIKSVIEQNYEKVEYIVLDAVSTDDTQEIIDRYRPHIAQYRSEKDGGPNAAYNEGIERATGDIVIFLNADDWLEPDILHAAGDIFSRDPELEIITCVPRIVRENENGVIETVFQFKEKRLPVDFGAYPVPNTRFYRKCLFERVGVFLTHDDQQRPLIMADLEFLLRLCLDRPKQFFLNQLGYTYLAHDGSTTYGDNRETRKRMYYQRAFVARQHLTKMKNYPRPARKLIRRWHRRATTRLCLWHWAEKERSKSLHYAGEGIAISPFLWVPDLLRLIITGRHKR